MPKCVVDPDFDWQGRPGRICRPWDDSIIFETHVKGITKQHPQVADALRGTYAGLASKAPPEYLTKLGITTIELLPVHAFVQDSNLLEKGLRKYWGYNSIGFFAPYAQYAAQPAESLHEFKEMVPAIHAEEPEVILDVVYNHTVEGNELGPTLSFKGIDKSSDPTLVAHDNQMR